MSFEEPVRPKDRFLVFGSPLIEQAEIDEVVATMRSGWLGSGPKVEQFEDAFRRYKNAHYAVALNSCTSALHLSIMAAGIVPGDEVITTPMTFCATINAIIHAGATPVLADVDPITFNIDPEEVCRRITPKTKAIVPVHFGGRACNMDVLKSVSEDNNLKIIEDCAHAIETEYKGAKVGTIGDFGCFSFYVTKNIVTGEGGMVLANNERDAARIKVLALHGMSKDAWKRFGDEGYKHYQVIECGYKYNMMDIQAAIGIHQLERIESCWLRRQEIWNVYMKELANLPLGLPSPIEPDTRHAYHLFTVLVDAKKTGIDRDQFLNAMTANNIGVGVHYLSIPEHPYYQEKYGWYPKDYPHAARIGRETVSIPLSAKLTEEDVRDVIKTIRLILANKSV